MGKDTTSQVRYFDKYMYGICSGHPEFDFANKSRCIDQHITYMLNRTHSMFRWSGLPETIPARALELYLQTNGNTCFYRYKGDLYIFTGALGGMLNAYYMPTIYTIANPALNLTVNAKIGEDCIVIPNDTMYVGLLPMFARYATAMTETELSIRLATINARIVDLISAPDDRTRASAEKYIQDIIDGKPGVIAENGFLDGVRAQPYASTGYTNMITNLIELEQYFKASWYNDLGLNANYNMKRESLNSSESQLNNDALLPLVDDMLACRKRGAEQVNAMFGTNITVELNSAWEDNAEEIDLEHEELADDVEAGEKGGSADEGGNETAE